METDSRVIGNVAETEDVFGIDNKIVSTQDAFGTPAPKLKNRTVFDEKTNTVIGVPENVPDEAIALYINGDYHRNPIEFNKTPKFLSDIARITDPVQRVTHVDPKLFTKKEQLKYGLYERIGGALEKDAWAVTEGVLRGMKGTWKFAEYMRPNYEIEKDFKVKVEGWLDRYISYYSQPEKYGFLVSAATQKREQYRTANYQKNYALGIASDVVESITDLGVLWLEMSAVLGAGKAGITQALTKPSMLQQLKERVLRLGTHGFLTTKGELSDRVKPAIYRIAYNITPYIANATGATGITAVGVDTALNTFLTSPTYAQALSESGGVNKEFLAMIVPQFIMDVGMAWHTRGLPENIRKDAIGRYIDGRVKEMRFTKLPDVAPQGTRDVEGIIREQIQNKEEGAALISKMSEDIVQKEREGRGVFVEKQTIQDHALDAIEALRNRTRDVVFGVTEDAVQQKLNQFIAKVDIEKPFKDINAPRTGFAIKNMFTRQEAERQRARVFIEGLNKQKLSDEDYVRATYLAAQPELLKQMSREQQKRLQPVVTLIRTYFDDHAKKLQEYEVIAEKWPQSLIKRLKDNNLHYRTALQRTRDKERTAQLKNKIDANSTIINWLQENKVQYVHLPLRVWMEDYMKTAPDKAPRVLSRFFKERDTADLQGLAELLIREGALDPQNVDIRRIMGAYADKVGRTYALSEIFQSAKREGLVKDIDKAPNDWVSAPPRLVPELKGSRVHPAFMDYLENFIRTVEPGMRLGRILGYTKILAFDNPLFLGYYNLQQGFWAGSFRDVKTPEYLSRGIKSLWQKDEEYWAAFENGLFSKPYIPPFKNFQKEIDLLTKNTFTNRSIEWLRQNIKYPLDIVYKPLWNIAWNFSDAIPRMTTYHYLRENKNMSPFEAAQLAAYFHGDYASVPPGTRKVLNRVFFTPTFKILMSKVQLSMIKSAGTVIKNAMTSKPSEERDKILAMGLVALVGLEVGVNYMMQAFGFETDDVGLRWYKKVDTDKGPREIVVYMASAGNNWLRYYHRWKNWPGDPDKLGGFLDRAKWDLHPLWRNAIMTMQNKKPDGEVIYNPFDPWWKTAENIGNFWARSIVAVLDRIPDPNGDYDREIEAYNALRKDMGKIYTLFNAMTPSKLVYLRKPHELKKKYDILKLKAEFKKFFAIDRPKNSTELRRRVEKFKDRLNQVRNEL